jgi:hypothetical protein
MNYYIDFSQQEKAIDMYQQGYGVPYISDKLGLSRREVCLAVGILVDSSDYNDRKVLPATSGYSIL